MRRNLTTLRAKQGHSANGAPRTLIDLTVYYNMQQIRTFIANGHGRSVLDTEYSGWSNATRPTDQAISLRQRTFPPRG
jgi:hypothetical protein